MERHEITDRLNQLFVLYEPLFTKKQIDYFKAYYYDDYSLHEIAELHDVSRNAVHDQLKRVRENLEQFETKLGLLRQRKQRLALYDELEGDCDPKTIEELRKLDE
ncbi:MAG: YlxM family DNA-binding protein [Acholeplasmataceae bacterium]